MFNRGSTSQSFDWHGAQRMCACLVVELPRNLHQSPGNEAKLIVYPMIHRVYSMSYRVYPMIYRVYPMIYRMYSMIYRVYPMLYRVYPVIYRMYSMIYGVYIMIYRCYRVCPIIYRDYSMMYRVYHMICRIYSMIYGVLVVHSKLLSQDALNHQTVFVITSIRLKHSEKKENLSQVSDYFCVQPPTKKIYIILYTWTFHFGCQMVPLQGVNKPSLRVLIGTPWKVLVYIYILGGLTNPSAKYARQIGSFSQVGVEIKI